MKFWQLRGQVLQCTPQTKLDVTPSKCESGTAATLLLSRFGSFLTSVLKSASALRRCSKTRSKWKWRRRYKPWMAFRKLQSKSTLWHFCILLQPPCDAILSVVNMVNIYSTVMKSFISLPWHYNTMLQKSELQWNVRLHVNVSWSRPTGSLWYGYDGNHGNTSHNSRIDVQNVWHVQQVCFHWNEDNCFHEQTRSNV